MAIIKTVKGIIPNIGKRCFLAENAAGALVTKDTIVEANSVYAGMPAKKIRIIDKELSEGEILRIANSYNMYARWHLL